MCNKLQFKLLFFVPKIIYIGSDLAELFENVWEVGVFMKCSVSFVILHVVWGCLFYMLFYSVLMFLV